MFVINSSESELNEPYKDTLLPPMRKYLSSNIPSPINIDDETLAVLTALLIALSTVLSGFDWSPDPESSPSTDTLNRLVSDYPGVYNNESNTPYEYSGWFIDPVFGNYDVDEIDVMLPPLKYDD